MSLEGYSHKGSSMFRGVITASQSPFREVLVNSIDQNMIEDLGVKTFTESNFLELAPFMLDSRCRFKMYRREANSNHIAVLNRFGYVVAIINRSDRTFYIPVVTFYPTPTGEQKIALLNELRRLATALCGAFVTPSVDLSKMTIGADIEASVVDSDGRFYGATNFVADSLEGSIGTDGNVDTIELRPDPANSPEKLTDNIEDILREMQRILPDGIDLLAGGGFSVNRSTGFHIHFAGTPFDTERISDWKQILPLCEWFDVLIGAEFEKVSGYQRADTHYGRPNDIRCRRNHGEFSHVGFEWRMPPNFAIDKEITLAVLVLSWLITKTYFAGKAIDLDGDLLYKYKQLEGFGGYKDLIMRFVERLKDVNLAVPMLLGWFGKKFQKDQECDMNIVMANGDFTGSVASWIMYNPQKKYNTIVIYERPESTSQYAISSDEIGIRNFLSQRYGITCILRNPSEAMMLKYRSERTLFIGIPIKFLQQRSRESHGSRNGIKLHVQSIIRAI